MKQKWISLLVAVSLAIVMFGALPAPRALAATITWDGGAGTSNWADADNWSGDAAPTSSDEVILDNSAVTGSYTVNLPTGATTVSIRKLTITPNAGNTITLILPSGNTAVPGFSVGDNTSNTDDIVLNSGAILRNSSGASSGNGIEANSTSNGTARINNGGRYVHNTARSTAGIVPLLSAASGTELGIFEYDSPGTGAVSISASGRNYGSLTLTRSAGAATYNASGSSALTVRGNFTINSGVTFNSTMTGALNLGGDLTNNGSALTLTQPAVINGSSIQTVSGTVTFASLTVNSGSILATGVTITTNGATTINGSFQLNSGGWATGSGTWTYAPAATLIFNSSSSYGVNSDHVYWPTTNGPYNVTVQGAGGITMNVARTVNGLFQTAAGVINGNNLTFNDTAVINTGGFFTGSPTYGAGSTLFYNTGGVYGRSDEWNSTSGAGYPYHVELANNTTLNYPTGTKAPKALAGDLRINGGSALYMDYGAPGWNSPLTVGGNVVLGGSLSLGDAIGGDLNVGGNWVNNGGTFYPNNRAVTFNGANAQTIGGLSPTTFAYLTINNAAGVSLAADQAVNNQLNLTNGRLTLGSYNLSLAAGATIGGAPSANNMVVATGSGELRKVFTAPGAFTFPVGDNDGTAEYSPATLNFTSGSFSGAYAGVRLADAKHPNNGSPTDYLTRYWAVSQSGISGFSCDTTFTYLDADIVGTESNLYTGQWNGTTWTILNPANTANNTIGGTVTSFSDFTAGEQGSMSGDTAPSVVSTDPADGAVDVATDTDITVVFSEPVNVSNIDSFFDIYCEVSGVPTLQPALGSGGPTTFTINPTANLPAGSSCTITIYAAQVTDQDANDPPDNMAADYEFTFDTLADAAPTVVSTVPADGATNVPAGDNLSVTFSEPVDVAGFDSFFDIYCDMVLQPAAGSGGPITFTINPNNDLPAGASCTVTIYAAQVTDQDANDPPDNMAADYSWSFVVKAPVVLVINELDSDTPGTDTLEFVELYDGGAGNTPLDGYVVVFYNGNGDVSYAAYDLDGKSTNASGYFLLGNSAVVPTPGIVFANNFLQNGEDAVALYAANASDFPNGTPVTTANLVDAIVYDTSDPDDPGLLVLLNAGQPQVDENSNSNSANESNQRCPNGSGGQRNTDTYLQRTPTAGATNNCPPDVPPTVSSTSPANGATNVPTNTNLTITFSEPVTVNTIDSFFDIFCDVSGVPTLQPATGSGGPKVYTINPTADLPGNSSCTVTIKAARVTDQDGTPDNMAADYVFTFTTGLANVCGNPANLISAVQGSGTTSPLTGSVVTIEGIVVGDFQRITGNNRLSGFFVMEENADFDGNPVTSEGIFVYEGTTSLLDVALGDLVRLTGTVTEYGDRTVGTGKLTEVSSLQDLQRCSTGNTLTPVPVTLPETADGDLERYEGMLISIASPMTVAQNYFVGRYGQMTLSASGRLYQPTNQALPGSAEAIALADLNARSALILDDGMAVDRCGDNPTVVPYLGPAPGIVIRAGDSVSNLVGVLDYGQIDSGETGGCTDPATLFTGDYRLHPTQAPTFTPVNLRPALPDAAGGEAQIAAPDAVGGNIRVAAFNVLNYFNTFTGCTLGVGGATTDCRGADNATEFTRQRDKIIAAITTLNADVIGIMEMENDGYGSASAIQDLVNGLNAVAGPGTYAFIDADARVGSTNVLGVDAIKVGVLYKPAKVTVLGTAALNTLAFTDPLYLSAQKSRPALAQTFEETTWGERFTVVVNHLKSKGSCPTSGVDVDLGQGCWNATRTAAASYLVNTWLPTDPTGSGDPDFIIVGDMNAYAREDPIETIKAAGYTDVINAFMGPIAYSYIFDGQSGYLDHALAENSLAAQVTGVTEWHINADEPEVINYNTEFNSGPYYAPDAYRSSDHDPVLVGLGLYPDLSDLPASYGTAWHTGQGAWRLGSLWTGEATSSDGSDNPSDDGVSITSPSANWGNGLGAVQLTVTAPAGVTEACLNAWMDFTDNAGTSVGSSVADGDFDDTFGLIPEHVVQNALVIPGTWDITFPVPPGLLSYASQSSYAFRFRLSPAPCPITPLLPTGRVDGGEVEDYTFTFSPLAVTLAGFTALAAPEGVTLAWETVSELGNAGFNVYRADAVAGLPTEPPAEAWVQLNETLIPAATPGSSQGNTYTWTDTTAAPGATYWYALEDVGLDGTPTRHTPVEVTVAAPNAVGLAAFRAVGTGPSLAGLAALAALALATAGVTRRRRR